MTHSGHADVGLALGKSVQKSTTLCLSLHSYKLAGFASAESCVISAFMHCDQRIHSIL